MLPLPVSLSQTYLVFRLTKTFPEHEAHDVRRKHVTRQNMIYARNSRESDDRPKLTGRQAKGNNWIMNTIKSLGRERSNAEALSVVPFFRLS